MARVLVTGGNRGIGFELSRQLHERGDEVAVACRSASAELRALGVGLIEGFDVTDPDAIAALEKASGPVDVLINNAGVMVPDNLQGLDLEGIRKQFEVNALGPLMVTSRLQKKLQRGGKVAIITSRMGSISDNGSGAMYGYRMSKAAVNMAGSSLALDLQGSGVAVRLIHPGFVKTDMTGGQGHVTPVESARNIIARIDEMSLENTGSFVHANGEALPW